MRTQRKILSLLVVLCMLLAMLPTVFAADEPATSGTCGDDLTWTLEGGVLTISGTGAMGDYGYDFGNLASNAPWAASCEQITSVILEEGVTSITYMAFADCVNLTTVSVPASVAEIDYDAFYGCTSLTDINVDAGNTAYSSVDGVLFDKAQTTLSLYPTGKTAASYTIPDGVTTLDSGAFAGNTHLTTVAIPDSVTSLLWGAFTGCTGLTSITIPDSVTKLGVAVFYGCTSLESVTIGSGITGWAESIFEGCTSLTSITIPDSMTFISDYSFYNCTGLTSAIIGDSVTYIGYAAFYGCTSLGGVYIPAGVTTIDYDAFNSYTGLTDVYYGGSEEEWAAIEICTGNDSLLNATIHYNSAAPEEPTILTAGTDETYTQGSGDPAVIHCTGALADLVSVSVDGQIVDGDNYTLEEGSTILTFKSAYLNTLSVGEHTVTLTYTLGRSVDVALTVLEKADEQEPANPENPGDEQPGTEQPGDEQPGGENPENPANPENPGEEQPGTENPGGEEPAPSEGSDVPKTGDSFTAVWGCLLMIALAGAVMAAVNRRNWFKF